MDSTLVHTLRAALPIALLAAIVPLSGASCGDDDEGSTGSKPMPTPAQRLCSAIADYVEKCGASPCDQALVDDCADVASMLSDPYLGAAADCIDDGGAPANCFASATSSLDATDAQRTFASSFCSSKPFQLHHDGVCDVFVEGCLCSDCSSVPGCA